MDYIKTVGKISVYLMQIIHKNLNLSFIFFQKNKHLYLYILGCLSLFEYSRYYTF